MKKTWIHVTANRLANNEGNETINKGAISATGTNKNGAGGMGGINSR